MQPQGPYTPQPLPQYTPAPPPQQQAPSNLPPGYEFIHNAQPPQKQRGPQTTLGRVLVIAGGLIAVIIIFSIGRSILSGGGNGPLLVAVAQDQQEIIHLATNAKQVNNLSISNKNFANTASLSMTSDQASTIAYMGVIKVKANQKTLAQKISAKTDSDLKAAEAASTYDTLFKDTMKQKLEQYRRDLQLAHDKTPGKNGKKLLENNYAHSELLSQQLDTSIAQ